MVRLSSILLAAVLVSFVLSIPSFYDDGKAIYDTDGRQ
jgi:hypothetical protein